MCLITTKGYKTIKTRKDRTVYKSLSINQESLYYGFKYNLDELYKTDMKESTNLSACDGIEARTCTKKFGETWWDGKNKNIVAIGKGYHSYNSLKRINSIRLTSGEYTFKCTIPKGSLIIEGYTGCLVSNQIIINEIIN